MPPFETIRTLPDIALEKNPELTGTLDWVGMRNIEVPVRVTNDRGEVWMIPAQATAFVNLDDPAAKGIHMSRLYLILDEILNESLLNTATIRRILDSFLQSHIGISSRSYVSLNFEYMLRRPSLVSGLEGWRKYPVTITGCNHQGDAYLDLSFEIVYSSTCPCSAALARQAVQDQFSQRFAGRAQVDFNSIREWLGSEDGMVATPHAQRSVARIKVRLKPDLAELPLIRLINVAERALQTVVQTVVKREDEQAFARLNGDNLMFCEDAARKLKAALDQECQVVDFWIRVSHLESLHPHDAVSVVTKGIPGGFRA